LSRGYPTRIHFPVPNDDIKLRELLERFGLIERFTPYVAGGRGALRRPKLHSQTAF